MVATNGALFGVFTWLQTWAEVIAAIGSVALTLALVVLYKQQKDLLSRQFSVENTAILEAGKIRADNRKMRIRLSNVGNGIAVDPHLVCVAIYISEESKEDEKQVWDGWIPIQLRRSETESRESGSVIEPGEAEVEYIATSQLPTPSGMEPAAPATVFEDLKNLDVDIGRVHYFLMYSDLTDTKRARYLSSSEFTQSDALNRPSDSVWKPVPLPDGVPDWDPNSESYDLSDADLSAERMLF